MSSACVCHIDGAWCFYCEMYSPVVTENERLKAEIKVESLRAAEWEGEAQGYAEMWSRLRDIVTTNATGGGGENINDYDIMLNVMDDIEAEVSEDAAS